MNDERLDRALERARAEYNTPPEPPREEIWEGIRAALDEEGASRADVVSLAAERRRRWSAPRVAGWATAAAAVLALGIGIGRMSVVDTGTGGPAGPARGGVEVASSSWAAHRTAALDHLSRSESLLELVRSDARAGRVDRDVGTWGRGLLTETRLLLDSPAGDDPALRALLEDLELILAQVAVLSADRTGENGGRARQELRLIAEGLDQQDVLSRIQAVLPSESGLTSM